MGGAADFKEAGLKPVWSCMTIDSADTDQELTYEQALAYLYSLANYEYRRIERYAPDVLDLGRMARLLGALGDPQRRDQGERLGRGHVGVGAARSGAAHRPVHLPPPA